MSDGLDLLDDAGPPAPRRNRRRRARLLLGAIMVGVILGAGWFGVQQIAGLRVFGTFEDYEGTGDKDVLVSIEDGQSISGMGSVLAKAGVVASSRAFVAASEDNDEVATVQPGYYLMKTRMSGEAAADRIVRPDTRVGHLQIRPGTQLDDIEQPNSELTPGLVTQLSRASCADINGESTCVPTERIREAIESADPAELGIPQWAVEGVRGADPKRWIEGLVMPGLYDVKPGSSAMELLRTVLSESATTMQAWGVRESADGLRYSPYELLILASLVEREAVKQDFAKVSRVAHNRLDADRKLEFDSTVNYVLYRPEVRTSGADRSRAGPYNTYANRGLPPTPIAAPSQEAITAAAQPADGDWMYFVKCYKNGISCFAETLEQHQENRREAQNRGAY